MRIRAKEFIEEHKDDYSEISQKQEFWYEFFNIYGKKRNEVSSYEFNVKRIDGAQGFIDLYWPGKLIIEHKSRGKNLDDAFLQALGYMDTLSSAEKPKYIIVSDFARIRLYDLVKREKTEIKLEELEEKIDLFSFIYVDETIHFKEQKELNTEAAELMANLHDEFKKNGYEGHQLELLLIRLLFCVYAEDTGIFARDQFTKYIFNEEDPGVIGPKIQFLFRILDQKPEERQTNIPTELNDFPYVNGDLFKEPIVPPFFNKLMYEQLLKICRFRWDKISPAIFGTMFQYVIEEEDRRNLGAHYTSETNILKVINALFMNDLWEEFHKSKRNFKRLERLWKKIGELKFFDPACGCGNFLIITYRELRLLEFEIIKILRPIHETQIRFDTDQLSKIKLENFYGIEIEEFPSRIAEVSMWFMQHQLDLIYEKLDFHKDHLPLRTSANIINKNALEIEWEELLSPSKNVFILGNPPFSGSRYQTKKQKSEMKTVFKGIKRSGLLDYVSAWYLKAAKFIQNTPIKVGFVSTNSICQGDQVGILWEVLLKQYNIHINFAHQYFQWNNEAKNKASVFVIIIGFSIIDEPIKYLYTYKTVKSEPEKLKVKNINPYLLDSDNIIIKSRTEPICDVSSAMKKGSKAYDYGFLTLKNDIEKEKLIKNNPKSEKYIRKFMSASNYLKNKHRYCLWLVDLTSSDLKEMPDVEERIKKVKIKRENSSDEGIRKMAKTPALFENNQPLNRYLVIPVVSSSEREYIPMGFLNPDVIVTNACYTFENASLYDFGLLTSKMHMLWMDMTCGKLKGDYRYSKKLAYNNFPFPKNVSENNKKQVIEKANNILKVRDKYPSQSLFDLYNPLTMYPDLIKAHQELNKSVEKCYRRAKFKDDNDRLKFLFDLYKDYTK